MREGLEEDRGGAEGVGHVPFLGRVFLHQPVLVLLEVVGLAQEGDGIDHGRRVGRRLQVLVQGIVAVVGHHPGRNDGRPDTALAHALEQDVQAGIGRVLAGGDDLRAVVVGLVPFAQLLGPLLVGIVGDVSVQVPHGVGHEGDAQVLVPGRAVAGGVFQDVDAVLFHGGGIVDGAPGVELALEGDVRPFAGALVAGDRQQGGDAQQGESREDMLHCFHFNRWRCCSPKCGKPGLTLQESCLACGNRRHISRKRGYSIRPGSGRLPARAAGLPAVCCPG